MGEEQHVERRLQLLEDRQKNIEERQGKFDSALASLRTDLVDTERRLTKSLHDGLDSVRDVVEREIGKVEDHLTSQDNHLLGLSSQIGVAKASWPTSAKMLAGVLSTLLAAFVPILYFLLR